ncbi:MAG: cupredoxin domain-containing protein [Nitrospirae bacterium]|nr:cupredoxin domain-containing protein [Nitrospirota bacterium]
MLAGVAFTEEVTKARKVFKAVVGSDGAQRVEITAGEYFFDPDYIIVKVNVPVAIKIKKKEGITPHDIVINAPEAGINIKESLSTEPKVIIFTPIKTGKYPFYCSKKLLFFKSHRSRGMEGVLDVIE